MIDLPWWGYVLIALAFTHVTIASVTIYLHRCQAHRALELHPAVAHFFRFWLWLTTGTRTIEWVAVHRLHHAAVETPEDPHSPHVLGIRRLLLEGYEAYAEAIKNPKTMANYGHGCPDDWLEHKVYAHSNYGIGMMLLINFGLFGPIGITIWAVQMVWIPIFAAGVINGIGHWWGYRNYETLDGSTNIVPWGILIGGEELHNNHHAYPSSARLSARRFELDIGWCYIRALELLRLAKVKRQAPRPVIDPAKTKVDLETAKAIIASRMHVLQQYARRVVTPVLHDEIGRVDEGARALLKRARRALIREESRHSEPLRTRLQAALNCSVSLKTVYEFRQRLQQIWAPTSAGGANHECITQALQEWCAQAEASGIAALRDFAVRMRGYSVAPAI